MHEYYSLSHLSFKSHIIWKLEFFRNWHVLSFKYNQSNKVSLIFNQTFALSIEYILHYINISLVA